MSTSLLYHGWGIRDYQYVRTSYVDGRLIFTVKPDPFSVTCPVCGSHDVLQHGSIHRLWREVPIGPKPVVIQMDMSKETPAPLSKPPQKYTQNAVWRHPSKSQWGWFLQGLPEESSMLFELHPVAPSVVPQDSRPLNMRSKAGRCLSKVNQINAIRDPAVFKLFPDFTQNKIRQTASRQNSHIDIGSLPDLASGHRAEKVDLDIVPLQTVEKNVARCLQIVSCSLNYDQQPYHSLKLDGKVKK